MDKWEELESNIRHIISNFRKIEWIMINEDDSDEKIKRRLTKTTSFIMDEFKEYLGDK